MSCVLQFPAPRQSTRQLPSSAGKVVRLSVAKARRTRAQRAEEQRKRLAQQELVGTLDELRQSAAAGEIEDMVFIVQLNPDDVRCGGAGVNFHLKSKAERLAELGSTLRHVSLLVEEAEDSLADGHQD